MNETLDYYNQTANEFFESTVNADMGAQYSLFEKYLYKGSRILDCGCGSGRDSKHFIEKGFDVCAIDGSEELCKRASELTGLEVQNILFQNINFTDEFDGVWACASLLHVAREELPAVMAKIKTALVSKGIMYVSFKYGDFSGKRNGRFFTDMTEESFRALVEEVGGFEIKETYVSEDVRPGRENEKWLNTILIKNEDIELKKKDELVETDDVETLQGEVAIDEEGHKILKIREGMAGIDFQGIVARAVQWADIGKVVGNIEKKIEYVVKIPAKYQKQFEAGEYFINKNSTTGMEWPTLMKKADNGRYQFVDNLPIEQQQFIQGNPFHDMCQNYHNVYMQQQMAQIAEAIAEMKGVVERIAQGQQDDRIALINSGQKEIMTALTLKDEESKRIHIETGRSNLLLGQEQLGKALERRIDAFDAIPSNPVLRFGKTVIDNNYLNKKDDAYEEIDRYYDLYHRATNMLAMSWGITGELDALQRTYEDSITFVRGLNLTKIKTIEYAHEGADLSELFYKSAISDLKKEKQICLEAAENYEYISIEVSGDKLLEVIESGKVK